ncbi:hypothetical protein ATANTOWER_019208, partial [Ataeniobius toweri]|nr:hypothetical protein [Ataeniobius toweri]
DFYCEALGDFICGNCWINISLLPKFPCFLHRVDQQSPEGPSGPSPKQHQTQLDSIFMLLEDNIILFVKKELKKIQKVLSLDDQQCSESQKKYE